ncbi:MAG TPA: hypothetical protein VHZ33_14055 [Trebonia sp.]|jgi:hypothetical protein|nr:hypothetical protein [Trebonia sp.]
MLVAIIVESVAVVPGKNAVVVPGISRQRRHFPFHLGNLVE